MGRRKKIPVADNLVVWSDMIFLQSRVPWEDISRYRLRKIKGKLKLKRVKYPGTHLPKPQSPPDKLFW
jgi:hypothetical protein